MLLHVHVEHAHVLAAGMTVTARKRDMLAKIATEVDDAHKRELRRKTGQRFARVVTAAIVDKNQLGLCRDIRDTKVLLENVQIFPAEFLGQIGIVVNRNNKGVFDHGSNGSSTDSYRVNMTVTISSSPHRSKTFSGQSAADEGKPAVDTFWNSRDPQSRQTLCGFRSIGG